MLIRNFIFWLSTKKTLTDAIGRRGMKYGFAQRFVAGEALADALDASRELAQDGRRVSLNHLGENVSTVEEAERARDSYIEMTRQLHAAGLDGNISIKLTQLGLDFDRRLCERLTGEIAAAAGELGRSIEMDMEGSKYTDSTLDVFEATAQRVPGTGLAIQAYLFRSEHDIERLMRHKPKIRLVKGAYRESSRIAFQKKSQVDSHYRKRIDQLLDHCAEGRCLPAIATHDPLMLDHARAGIKRRGLTPDRYEFQMIYGIRRDLQQALRAQGHPLRIYVPFGTEWCPYFMRRLSERPANCWFVLRNLFAESSGNRRGA
jgi:proline dehydrogenase